MTRAYINYPNVRIVAHRDPGCGSLNRPTTKRKRVVKIDRRSLSNELRRFERREHDFGSTQAINDMWLSIDLGDHESELEILRRVKAHLERRYSAWTRVDVEVHCR